MTDNPLLSIIMPSLNVAPFIRECIESVTSQTLKDIEIICVDASSTDGTLEILREYEQKDPRIKVLISDKKSYGYQMNLGLDNASGKYIGIVETDDWIEPDMFETLVKEAREHDADVVKSNYYWYYTIPEVKNRPFENLKNCQYGRVFAPADDLKIFEVTPSIWSGIYRKDMLTKNRIRFNETPGAAYQDTSFHFMVFTCAKRVFLLNKYLLHYRRDNENSSVNTSGKAYCVSNELHYYESFLEGVDPDKRKLLEKPYQAFKYEKYRWNYARLAPGLQWDFLQLIHDEFVKSREAGLMDRASFTDKAWQDVNEIIDNPVRYFKNSCKKYSARPMGDKLPKAQLVAESKTASPDVTIVIPAYNDEDVVLKSIESARAQTHKNIEIICVDDGSDDGTLEVLLKAAGEDDRISVLHQVNMGLSCARNAAIDIAKGRYIQFLDSDDSLLCETAEELVKHADMMELDILYFDGRSVFEKEELKEKHPFYLHGYESNIETDRPLSGKDYYCLARNTNQYKSSACMALFRTAFLNEKELRFKSGILHEDNIFSVESVLAAERVWHTKRQFYERLVREGSVMTGEMTFFNVYGYLTGLREVLAIASALPYSDDLDEALSREIKNLCDRLRVTYGALKIKNDCRKKLTRTELILLDEVLKRPKHEDAVVQVKNSASYRAGHIIIWPLRKAKAIAKKFGMIK